MRRHLVDKMGYNENNIFPKIERRESRQHKRTSDFQKVTVFLAWLSHFVGGVAQKLWWTMTWKTKTH